MIGISKKYKLLCPNVEFRLLSDDHKEVDRWIPAKLTNFRGQFIAPHLPDLKQLQICLEYAFHLIFINASLPRIVKNENSSLFEFFTFETLLLLKIFPNLVKFYKKVS